MGVELKELGEALNSPELFISNFYFSTRSDIDLVCEELLATHDPAESVHQQLNTQREILIAELKKHEADCLDLFRASRASVLRLLEPIKDRFMQYNEAAGENQGPAVVADHFLARKILLRDRTYIFKRWDGKRRDFSIGRLIVADCSFNSREIELIRKIQSLIETWEDEGPLEVKESDFRSQIYKIKLSTAVRPNEQEAVEEDEYGKTITLGKLLIEHVVIKHLINAADHSSIVFIERQALFNFLTQLTTLAIDHSQVTLINTSPSCIVGDLAKFYDGEEKTQSMFELMTNLSSLTLNDNQLACIKSRSFYGLEHSLKELDLLKNALVELSERSFENLTQLETLKLNDNSIEAIDSGTFSKNLPSLKILELSDNNIKSLESDVFEGMEKLQELSLGRNRLKSVEKELFTNRRLNSLTFLYLCENHLTSLEDVFDSLSALEVVSLGFNKIKKLSPTIFKNNKSLREIYLECNDLSENELSPGLFQGLADLDMLTLSENKFKSFRSLSTLFDDLNMLTVLDLSGNMIEDLGEGLFKSLENLSTLSLKQNRLKSLSRSSLKGLLSLVALDVSNNQIEALDDDVFAEFQPSIANLNLSCNRMEKLNLNLFAGLTNLKIISLYGNEFEERDAERQFHILKETLSNLKTVKLTRNVM